VDYKISVPKPKAASFGYPLSQEAAKKEHTARPPPLFGTFSLQILGAVRMSLRLSLLSPSRSVSPDPQIPTPIPSFGVRGNPKGCHVRCEVDGKSASFLETGNMPSPVSLFFRGAVESSV